MIQPARPKPRLRVVLCAPRGFCAGVVRAIDIVERALELYGAPVYVRHEIVHNRSVVDSLKAKGVVFIKELAEAPPGSHPVIFSAHGVAKSVPQEAEARNLFTIDATCPLVTKVHREAQAHFRRGRRIILIGHVGHPEVIGTMGQLPPGSVTLVSSIEDIDRLPADDGRPIAYATQTTLSVDDTREIVAALQRRFPSIYPPPMEDICYATTNRQEAVKTAARQVEAVIVVGAANSSN
jgi:4-hydroxy-3-methylbut-2-enyl diphosphate reductase